MSDFDPLVPFVDAQGEFEARTIVAVLEDAGIEGHVFVLGDLGLTTSISPGGRGVPVFVRRSMVDRARQVLAESREIGASVDWDSIDVGEEPPFPPRRRMMRSLVHAFAVMLLVGGAAATAMLLLGASAPVTTRAFFLTLAAAFVVMVIWAGVREWTGTRGAAP